jgi:hypothetical protein
MCKTAYQCLWQAPIRVAVPHALLIDAALTNIHAFVLLTFRFRCRRPGSRSGIIFFAYLGFTVTALVPETNYYINEDLAWIPRLRRSTKQRPHG